MNQTLTKLFLSSLLFLSTFTAVAQSDIAEIVKAGPQNATALANAYIEPAYKGFGMGLNSGWFNTAKPHSLGGFDITFTGNIAFVPTDQHSFDVRSLTLDNRYIQPTGPNYTAQTVVGKDEEGAHFNVYNPNDPITASRIPVGSFNMPGGTGIGFVPTPTAQINVGLIKGTEVSVRFIPSFRFDGDEGKVNSYGFGLKHDIKQWIPVVKDIPFDLSIAGYYSSLKLTYNQELNPDMGTTPENGNLPTDFSNQRLETRFNAYNINAIISKKISVITFWGNVGYNHIHSKIGLFGNYPVTTRLVPTPQYTVYTDPVVIDNTKGSGVTAQAGFRLKLAFFTLQGSGSVGQYPTVNAGFGFSFR
ncbi:hypothetical protein D3C80_333220 [compost metagenome]